jgi:glycosyltransferase involved in cell wall biosynthesis
MSFISAIAEILLKDENLYLVCAGGFNFNKTEKKIINSLNLTDKIIFTGIESENKLITLYKKALCFVFPSLYEGFGFPILEAFQCCCPLICSNTSSFPEIAEDAAYYFDPYDIESIKDAVNKVLYDENLRRELCQKGYNQVEKFNWDKTVLQTKNVYKTALGL